MLTTNELKEWQDGVFKVSKELLQRDGYHHAIAILVTERERVRQTSNEHFKITDFDAYTEAVSQKDPSKALADAKPISHADIKAGMPAFITVPLDLPDADFLQATVDMACELGLKSHSEEEKKSTRKRLEQTIAVLLAQGKEFGVSNAHRSCASALLKALGAHEKDVQAFVLKKAIVMTRAYALIKIDEAWMHTERPGEGKDLTLEELDKEKQKIKAEARGQGISDHPDRIEGIMVMMETTEGSRMLFAEVIKEGGRDSKSKVLGFKKTMETSTFGTNETLEGRFVDLLRKAEKELNKELKM